MDIDLKLNFAIKGTKRNTISKGSMRKVLTELHSYCKENNLYRKAKDFTFFITDSENKEYCFGLIKGLQMSISKWDFSLDCTIINEDKMEETTTSLYCDLYKGKLDFEFSDYQTTKF